MPTDPDLVSLPVFCPQSLRSSPLGECAGRRAICSCFFGRLEARGAPAHRPPPPVAAKTGCIPGEDCQPARGGVRPPEEGEGRESPAARGGEEAREGNQAQADLLREVRGGAARQAAGGRGGAEARR